MADSEDGPLSEDEPMAVELALTTSISPDSSFSSGVTTDSEQHDADIVERILGLPEYDDLDICATINEETDIDTLQLERHTYVQFARPEPDVAGVRTISGQEILPFPLVSSESDGGSQVVSSEIDFHEIISPYTKNRSIIQLLADEQEEESEDVSSQQPYKPSKRRRRRKNLEKMIQAGLKHAASVVKTMASYPDLPKTRGDWKGQDYRHREQHIGLREQWHARTVGKTMAEGEHGDFQKIPYEGRPTCLIDKAGIAYAFRTERVKWMFEVWRFWQGEGTPTFIEVLNWECLEYMRLCGDNSKSAIDNNYRGNHWASIAGVDRQSKSWPFWTKFHRDHLAATLWLLEEGRATKHLIEFVTSTCTARFPMLAARVRACEKRLVALGCDPQVAKPMFGLWYNYCINGARPHAEVEGVSCEPHTDAQNLAIMMCALFIYGDFDWQEKAWLVLWEARVIIQLPIGVAFYYPSALFIHFNIDIFDFDRHIYTTKDGAIPTPETGLPVHGVKGRGSIVFFNQASVFQVAELGLSVGDAAKQSMSTAADNEPYTAAMPVFVDDNSL